MSNTFNVYHIEMRYSDFGKLVKNEREKRGWEQSDLAARMSVKQQSVSRWEKGTSRPKYDDVLGLVDLFKVDVYEWLAQAGYDAEEPDSALTPYLPLHYLSPENFELFCRDFIKALNPTADVSRYGTKGDTQDGIDILVKVGKKIFDYQCKRHKQFGPSEIEEVVKKNSISKTHHHFLLLSRIASAQSRKAILKHNDWTLWDREDIAREIRGLDKDAAARLIGTYFPLGWRERFLGIDGPSKWLPSDDFFRSLADRSKLFTHGWSFVGRKAELSQMKAYEHDSNVNALIIFGRGGIGKSRLLKDWADKLHQTDTIRFVSIGSEIEPKDIELLPDGPSYLVIDDAHERKDLLVILDSVIRTRPDTKVILCVRPYAVSRIEDDLSKTGFKFDHNKNISLEDLNVAEAKSLSEEILSSPDVHGDISYAERIAQITKDCPLATVIGSRLVGEGKIKPELLNNIEEFRNELLRRFRDVIAGNIEGSDSESIKDLLAFVAAIQPFNVEDQSFKEAIETFFNKPYDKMIRDITALEEAGILSRRGYHLRVIPDLLSDYIRAEVCYSQRLNKPTGYVDRIYKVLKNDLAINLLMNISQLDWRLSVNGMQTMLLNDIWDKILEEIKNANNADRSFILKKLKDVAYFQPEQMLKIVEYVKDNPAEKEEDSQYSKLYKYEHKNVLSELPEILKRIAYNLEYLPKSVDLIWEISRGDSRRTNSHPDHGIRVLQDLAQYDVYELTGKTVTVNRMMLEAVERWMEDTDLQDYVNSPLDILDELLSKESTTDIYDKGKITFHSFGVNFENTKEVRDKALQIVIKAAYSPHLKVSLRAIKSLQEALSEPRQLYGRQVNEEEKNTWKPFQLLVIEELTKIAEKQNHPIIQLEIKDSLHWHIKYGKSQELKEKARVLWNRLIKPFDNKLLQSLEGPYDRDWFIDEDDFDHEKSLKMNLEFRQNVVKEFIEKYPDTKNGFGILNQLLSDAEKYQKMPFPITFFSEMSKLYPDYADRISLQIISSTKCAMSGVLGYLLLGVVDIDPNKAASYAKKALDTNNDDLIISIADYYWRARWTESLIENIDIPNVKKLLNSNNKHAKKLAIGSLGRLAKHNPKLTKQLLLEIDLGDSKEYASEYCEQFDKSHYFDPDSLNDSELQSILNKLEKVIDIDDHSIEEFLEYLSERIPLSVVKFMINRVELSKTQPDQEERYRPFSYSLVREFKGIKSLPSYANVLSEIRDKTVDKTWQSHFWYPKLFKAFSGNYNQTGVSVLLEWVHSGEKEKLEAVGVLLHDAPENFVFHHPDFVNEMLNAGKKHGDKFFKSVRGDLASSAIYRSKHGTPGQPMPEDIELRDNSRAMLHQLPKGSPSYEFYELLVRHAEKEIEDQLKRDEEFLN